MKAIKLSFDFTDKPKLAEMLRVHAAQENTSQKAILVDALEAYFADKLERSLLLRAAEKTFAEWNNEDDSIYDTL